MVMKEQYNNVWYSPEDPPQCTGQQEFQLPSRRGDYGNRGFPCAAINKITYVCHKQNNTIWCRILNTERNIYRKFMDINLTPQVIPLLILCDL
jgi:hypothetical protein